MASEVEAKVVLSDCRFLEKVAERIAGAGGVFEGEVVEEDAYYQHPCRDFAATDEALRLRVVRGRGGARAELTYKGPKTVVGGVKRRVEVSVLVGDAAGADEVLGALGFRRVAVVRKRRRYYRVGVVSVTLDEVEGLGCFVEAEYKGSGGIEEAVRAVEDVLGLLGLSGAPRTAKSYLELLLEKAGR